MPTSPVTPTQTASPSPAPSYPSSQVPGQPAHERKVGPIVLALIVILVIIGAAVYFFASSVDQPEMPASQNSLVNNAPTTDVNQDNLNTPEDIEALNTELDGLTADLENSNF